MHADPENQEAIITLLLARTDLFDEEYTAAFERAKAVLPKLGSGYDRAYYEGDWSAVPYQRLNTGFGPTSVAVQQTSSGAPNLLVTNGDGSVTLAWYDEPPGIERYEVTIRVERPGEAAG